MTSSLVLSARIGAVVLILALPAALAGLVHREPAWTHSAYLDGARRVRVSWRPRERDVLFQLEAPTKGYVGLGFSHNGGMAGADIIVAWVDDSSGRAHLLVGTVPWSTEHREHRENG